MAFRVGDRLGEKRPPASPRACGPARPGPPPARPSNSGRTIGTPCRPYSRKTAGGGDGWGAGNCKQGFLDRRSHRRRQTLQARRLDFQAGQFLQLLTALQKRQLSHRATEHAQGPGSAAIPQSPGRCPKEIRRRGGRMINNRVATSADPKHSNLAHPIPVNPLAWWGVGSETAPAPASSPTGTPVLQQRGAARPLRSIRRKAPAPVEPLRQKTFRKASVSW